MLEELKDAAKYVEKKIIEKDIFIFELEKYAKDNNVPIVTKEVAEYLKFMVRMNKSKSILEIGTAIGYSGILMAREIEDDFGELVTIEIDESRYKEAKKNFKKAGLKNITLILGDAEEEIKKIKKEFDFVFIDASKGHYKSFFDDSYKLLKKGGVIFIDNIMFRGYLYKEYPKRFKTIVRKLDEFISYLAENFGGNFVLLPFGDGIGLVIK